MHEIASPPPKISVLTMSDRRSRWQDGVFASLLFLLTVVALIVTTILLKRVGPTALFIEAVVTFVASMFLLQRSYSPGITAVSQVWHGVLSGFLAWTTLEAAALLGQIAIETERGGALFLVTAVTFWIIRRHGDLSLGAQFFAAAILANWIGHLVLFTQRYLALNGYPLFQTTYRLSGVVAAIGIVVVYSWIFRRSQTPLERLWAALSVYVLVIIVLYAARGFW